MDAEHLLMGFGLTHQEARIYLQLHTGGPVTGYELAKSTGISRSNAYAGLSSLVEKGGAWLLDGKPVCYQAVPVGEFCGNILRSLEEAGKRLEKMIPMAAEPEEGYLTIRGPRHIRDKIENMILATKTHIYLSMGFPVLETFRLLLERSAARGKKVVVITDRSVSLAGVRVYNSGEQLDAIRVIRDTASALTGALSDDPVCSCLYSEKQNLVRLLRDSMRNEIKLIELTGGSAT